MKKSAIITGHGFEDSEYVYSYYRLQEAGFFVDVFTSNGVTVTGKYGIPAVPTRQLNDLDAHVYDLVIIPGGYEAPDRMRQEQRILYFIKEMHEKKKIISSICHGPLVLISAGVLKGRKATCYKGCKDDLINAGAFYIDKPVVIDDTIITAQHVRDNPEWMKQTLRIFG